MNIRELRDSTGLTQKEFAGRFGIPVGTLRRWEYGESTPADYIIKLIANQLNPDRANLTPIEDRAGRTFFYNSTAGVLVDKMGIEIHINTDLSKVKPENLPIYIGELFDSYYEMLNKFNQDCKLDQSETFIWG